MLCINTRQKFKMGIKERNSCISEVVKQCIFCILTKAVHRTYNTTKYNKLKLIFFSKLHTQDLKTKFVDKYICSHFTALFELSPY